MAPTLDAESIRRGLHNVAERLKGDRRSLIIVGGSYLALVELRESTEDVDTASRLDDDLKAAIAEVGEAEGWDSDWLNARALAYLPTTFDRALCTVLFEHPKLVALGPPEDIVFIMKLDRCEPQDIADMIELWPHTTFRSADEAVAAYFEGMPLAPPDEYLAAFVANEICAIADP